MASNPLSPLISLLLLLFLAFPTISPSPYLSPTIISHDYHRMLSSFRVFIYDQPNTPFNFTAPPFSLFQTSLLNSNFLTEHPDDAHLFFVPFSPALSTRSVARLVRDLRISLPYWNRTLGADHFFLSPAGLDFSPDRNVLELKKNSVQISLFPTPSGNFIPHKDVSLPPLNPSPLRLPRSSADNGTRFLGYMRSDGEDDSVLADELESDPDFFVDSEPSDDDAAGRAALGSSKFCLFSYGGDVEWIAEAMAAGCVPAVIVDRPVQDLPLIDVLRWNEMAVVVRAKGLKEALRGMSSEKYGRMRGLGVAASRHLVWNSPPQPYDAFHMVMYQLWLRRHTIRYARRE